MATIKIAIESCIKQNVIVPVSLSSIVKVSRSSPEAFLLSLNALKPILIVLSRPYV